MGKLTNAHKLTARTSPEVVEGVAVLLGRRSFASYKFLGRKLGIEGLVDAVVLDFLDRPERDQVAILEARLSELEEQVRGPNPAQKHGSGEASPPLSQGATVIQGGGKPKGRSKRA